MSNYPKFEKVDDKQMKVIVEKEDVVPVARLVANRDALTNEVERLQEILDTKEYEKQIKADIKKIKDTVDNINKMLKFAEKNGIVADEEEVKKIKKQRAMQALQQQQQMRRK